MTKADISELVDLTAGHFPNTQGKDRLEINKAWHESLGTYPKVKVREALVRTLRTARFWPSVAEILDMMDRIAEERERQAFAPRKSNCPNCGGLGAIAVIQDGEERYGRCPCLAGENYNGLPQAPSWAIVSDRRLVTAGTAVEGEIPF